MYCKNTAKRFWLLFNSKLFALVAIFSVLIHAALVLPDFFKKVAKQVFSISSDDPYSVPHVVFFLTWT